ncbi:MAG: MATE family efflux transporter [Prevotellaceae bacterium]|jgi:putative MATE family efflux protein|nr:MATE family efflux transporter [Prevotellaceae bacterium]
MQNQNAPLMLGTENIGKLLSQYALPAIIAMTAASLYNITDSIFIGHGVGKEAVNGLGITFPLMNLSAAFGSMIGAGASTLLSIRMGQKDYQTANRILGNVVSLNVIMGGLLAVFTINFLKPILRFFGASNETLPYAYDFMLILMAGNIFTHLYYGLNAMLRSSGNPMKAMTATIFTVVINLILNPLFIFGFHWGIKGSACATIISQILVLCWQFYIFSDKNYFIHFQRGIYKLKKKIVIDSFSIGLAPFLMNLASVVIILLINHQLLKNGGDDGVGAYAIVNRLAFLFIMIVMGLNQGMQPIAGYNYGAKLFDRVRLVLKKAILFATIIMLAGFVIIQAFSEQIASLFTPDANQIKLAAQGLHWIFLFYPLVGFQMVATQFFQSIGKANKSIILSLSRQVLILIPLLLILPNHFGVTGVWASMSISDLLSVILATILLTIELKKNKK